ncbi:hypothetical protein D3C86_1996960 [compost metagenome]
MPIGHQLTVARNEIEHITFQAVRITLDVIQHLRFQHEKSTIDPAFLLIPFLVENLNLIPLGQHCAETSWRAHCGYGRKLAVRSVKVQQRL